MKTEQIKKELKAIQGACRLITDTVTGLLEELEKESPSNPRKRRNLKRERIMEYDNYLATHKLPKKRDQK
jgi:hypothetical protein